MASPTSGSAQVIVQDDDFNYRVRLSVGADRTTLSEGQSVTLTFTFKTRHHREPHSDSGTFLINVTGDADDYSLSTTTFSAPRSTFMSTRDERHYVATSVVTFTAAVDDATEPEEQFTLSVTRGEGTYASTELPDALTLTIAATSPPDAPLSVAAEPAGTGEIDVSWQEPPSDGGSAITGYTVQWKEVSDSWNTPDDVSEADTSGTAYTITNLSPGVEYSVRVFATNSAGNGPASAEAGAKLNNPAAGQPAISGKAQVGETLTASESGIIDSDGRTGATFAYQWIRNDGTAGAAISGATGSTYSLGSDDEGKTIKVRVSFTDDVGNAESLTSPATAAVAPAPGALTAQFLDTPSSHDGKTTFTFKLRFSEESLLSYKTLRDHAFTATGGEVTKSRRLEEPRNVRWKIHVSPDGDGDVTVVLPVTTDCAASGAICAEDGRKLSAK